MRQALTQETEEICASVLRSANYFIEQESIRAKEILTKDLLKQVENLCKKQCQNTSLDATSLFVQKVVKEIGRSMNQPNSKRNVV